MHALYPEMFRRFDGVRFHRVAGTDGVYCSVDIPGLWRLETAISRMPVPHDVLAQQHVLDQRRRLAGLPQSRT